MRKVYCGLRLIQPVHHREVVQTSVSAVVQVNKDDSFSVRYQDLGTISGKFV